MKPEHEPEVINLQRYRKATADKAAEQTKAKPSPVRRSESLFGGHPHAKVIFILVLIGAFVLLILPRLPQLWPH